MVTTFNFKAGCVTVRAADANNPANRNEFQLPLQINATPAAPEKKTFAVFRGKAWSRELQVTTTAHEGTCTGVVVAQRTWTELVPETGVKEAVVELSALDADGDGFVSRANPVFPGTDCDDADAARFPGNPEVCDFKDNDCNNQVDDGLPVQTYYRDADGDTYGVNSNTQQACKAPTGYAARGGDCNDANAKINPGAAEVCNDIDDNCNGQTDEGFNKDWYVDADGDTYRSNTNSTKVVSCATPPGPTRYTQRVTPVDCNDTRADVNPGATELCNGIDDDCDGLVDEGYTFNGLALNSACKNHDTCASGTVVCNSDGKSATCNGPLPTNWYVDDDRDGFGTGTAVVQCTQPPGHVGNNTDCNDGDPWTHPGADEICDQGRDNDCNTSTTESLCTAAWRTRTDTALGTIDWNGVTLDTADANPIWIAGAAGTNPNLAYLNQTNNTFTIKNECNVANTPWNAIWTRPGGTTTSTMYVVGNDGQMASDNTAGGCDGSRKAGSSPLNGVVGFNTDQARIYSVSTEGKAYEWRVGSNTHDEISAGLSATRLYDVHGDLNTRLFAVGSNDLPAEVPMIWRGTGTVDGSGAWTGSWTTQLLPSGALTKGGALRAVFALRSDLAWAVGDNSLALIWNGTAWSELPAVGETVRFTGVRAFGRNSVYTTDESGKVRRFNGTTWEVLHNAGAGAILRDIALFRPDDIWVVGNAGRVIRWK